MTVSHRNTCATGRADGCDCGRKEWEREYLRRYRVEHRDQIRETIRGWHKRNPDKQAEYSRRYRAKDPDRHRQLAREQRNDPAVQRRSRKRVQEDQARAMRSGPWSADEIVFLLGEPSNKIVAETLGRTRISVSDKRRKMKEAIALTASVCN